MYVCSMYVCITGILSSCNEVIKIYQILVSDKSQKMKNSLLVEM
jgi:hypothetical protein